MAGELTLMCVCDRHFAGANAPSRSSATTINFVMFSNAFCTGPPTFDDMTGEEQEWLATLGFSEEDEEWPPRRGPTIKELKQVFDTYTRTGMDGEALEPKALRELWGSGSLSMWCGDLEVSKLLK